MKPELRSVGSANTAEYLATAGRAAELWTLITAWIRSEEIASDGR